MYYSHAHASQPGNYDSFLGTATRATFQVGPFKMFRGHDRDSESNKIIVGRYRYMAKVSDFVDGWGDEPKADDVMSDDGVILQVTAVRKSVGGLAYLIEASKVET